MPKFNIFLNILTGIFFGFVCISSASASTKDARAPHYILTMSEDSSICKPLTALYNKIFYKKPRIIDIDYPGDVIPEYLFPKYLKSIGLRTPTVPEINPDGELYDSSENQGLGLYIGDVFRDGKKRYFETMQVEMHGTEFGAVYVFYPNKYPILIEKNFESHFDPKTIENIVEIAQEPYWAYSVNDPLARNIIVIGKNYKFDKWIEGKIISTETGNIPLGKAPKLPFYTSIQRAYTKNGKILFIAKDEFSYEEQSILVYYLSPNKKIVDMCYIVTSAMAKGIH